MKTQNLVHRVLIAGMVIGMGFMGSPVRADDTVQLKEKVQALQNRVDQLEAKLAAQAQAAPLPNPGVDPFVQVMQMQRNMQQALAQTQPFTPRMDMKQTDKQYIITMDIPGRDKNKIDVELKEGILIISGEGQTEKENNANQYYSQGRSYSSFMQVIPLPKDAKKDQIEATYQNGVLKVEAGRVTKQENKVANKRIVVN